MNYLRQYQEEGYAICRNIFSAQEVEMIKHSMNDYCCRNENDGIVTESDGVTIRGLHGAHLYDEYFSHLVRDSRFLDVASVVLSEPFYVHQFKINVKSKMKGASWPWHQDYIFWSNEDGIPESKMINIALLLADVDILHGPLCIIPKSHQFGNLSKKISRENNWKSDVSSELSYQLDAPTVAQLIDQYGVEYMTGKAGDVFLFDPQLAHCSSSNLSPNNRELLIITYNPCSNRPRAKTIDSRPEFLCGRDFSPLLPVEDFASCVGK
jgi:ectoine hydroxylase